MAVQTRLNATLYVHCLSCFLTFMYTQIEKKIPQYGEPKYLLGHRLNITPLTVVIRDINPYPANAENSVSS